MGLPVEQKRRYTIREYFQLEHESSEKHEFLDGELIMMAGASADHGLITANMIRAIGNRLEGGPCRVYDSSLRIRVARGRMCAYPDLTVICGPRMGDPEDPFAQTYINPRLIVEVLSPSIEAYDRGEKFDRYRELDALEEYVLVSQATARVETFWRREEGTWLLTPVAGLEATAKLRCLNVELPLREIYAGVEFPPAGELAQ